MTKQLIIQIDPSQSVTLPSEIKSCLKLIKNKAADVVGVEIRKGSKLPEQARLRAIANLEEWARPIKADLLVDLLTELRMLTSTRNLSRDDLINQLKVYANRLMDHPSSIVEYVLKSQPNISKWWPEWFELELRLSLYARKNKSALEALKNYRHEKAEEKKKPVTSDQIKEIMAKIAKENSAKLK